MSAGYCQRALVDESGMIITRMGMHNRSEMVAVHRKPCAIPPRNSNTGADFFLKADNRSAIKKIPSTMTPDFHGNHCRVQKMPPMNFI
jgi:hypothetical protein